MDNGYSNDKYQIVHPQGVWQCGLAVRVGLGRCPGEVKVERFRPSGANSVGGKWEK